MSIGIAFSGGGVPAAISAACAWNAIVETYPSVLGRDVTVSTVSGGSIGYGLWVNARDRIQFTPYHYNMTLEELFKEHEIGTTNADNQNEPSAEAFSVADAPRTNFMPCDGRDSKRTVGDIAGDLFTPAFLKRFVFGKEDRDGSHWWGSIIRGVFLTLCVDEINGGDLPWLTSFAFFNQSVPYDRNKDWGVLLPSSADAMYHVIVDMNNGDFKVTPVKDGFGDGKRLQKLSPIDVLSYSSAFWASNVLSNNVVNLFFNKMLIINTSSVFIESSDAEISDVVVMDGGVVDTTGIIGLLRQKKEHVIAFYNNNIPLSSVSSPIAYLFGVDTKTDSMNSLKGPIMSQVFPSLLYPSVFQNLTDSRIGMAHLMNVDVLQNHQMGVEPYTLKSLLILSNGKLDGFQFGDKRIQQRLAPNWPDRFSYGLPKLDSNVLCAFNEYKVKVVMKKHDPFVE